MKVDPELKLAELAEAAGVPARTVRLYIAKGLVPPPRRAGRDAAYGPEHLEALRRIREGQREGLTLEQIRHRLAGERPRAALPDPVGWWSYALAPDVTVNVRGDVTGARLRRIRDAISVLQGLLQAQTADDAEETEP